MGAVTAIIKFWKVGLVFVLIAALGVSYHLWTVNAVLRSDLAVEEQQTKVLREARIKDASAAKQLVEAVQATQAMLLKQLDQLGDIQDAEGRDYLDTVVPDTVIRLFQ